MGKDFEEENQEKSKFEKELLDINEQNIYGNNPGHWAGKVDAPIGLRRIYRNSVFLIISGLILILPGILNIFSEITLDSIMQFIGPTLLGFILIICGVLRLKK